MILTTLEKAINFKNRQTYVYFNCYFNGHDFQDSIENKDKNIKSYSDSSKLIKKIQDKHNSEKFICNIIGHIKKVGFMSIRLDHIFRIELLSNDGDLIDYINIHQEGVPLEIREEFNTQFHN